MFKYKRFFIGLLYAVTLYGQESDLTVERCVEMALANNPVLRMAEMQSRIADESGRQAQSDMLPSLAFSGSYRRQSMVPELDMSRITSALPFPLADVPKNIEIGSPDVYDFRVTLNQPLFTGFQLSNRKHMTQKLALAKNSDAAKSRAEVVYKVRLACGQFLKAQRFLEIARTGRDQVAEHLRVVQNFIRQGIIGQEEGLKVQVKLTEAEVAVVQAENAVRLAKSALEHAMGVTLPQNSRVIPAAVENIQSMDVQSSLQQALAARNELRSIQYTIQAAESAARMARGGYFPVVAAFATGGYGKPGLNFVDKEWMDYWIVGVGMEWNLWNWNKTSSLSQQAKLNVQSAREGLREAELAIRTDVTMACLQVNEAVERLRLTNELQQQAAESFRVIENKYAQGVAGNSDFLDAQMDLTRAMLQKAQAEADYQVALANHQRAVGGSNP